MNALRDIGEYVDSPTKRILEEPVKRAICAYLELDYQPPATHAPSTWRRSDPGGPGKRSRPRPGRPASAGPKGSGTLVARPPDRSVGLGDTHEDVSVTMEEFSWAYHGFSAPDRDAWRVSTCVPARRRPQPNSETQA